MVEISACTTFFLFMHYLIFTMHKIVMQCIFQKSVFSPLLEGPETIYSDG